MKFLKLSNDLITDKNITSNEFRIYAYLLSLYNSKKDCAYPSMKVIAKNLGLSEKTVVNSVNNLTKLGYMVIEKKKGINGNYNTYKNLKYLIKNIVKPKKKKEVKKPIIPSECKENNGDIEQQIEVKEIIPFTVEHQQKISLVMKQGIKLTEKQMWLLGDFTLEALREAIRVFKKQTKTNTFAFLINTYYTACSKLGVIPSTDIQRYCKNKFVGVSDAYINDLEVEEALKEFEGGFCY